MIEIQKAIKFLDYFSIITVGKDKVPNFQWKDFQKKKNTVEKFSQHYNFKGKDYTDQDGNLKHQEATTNFGIVTGFEDLECIDVDLKVFSTAKEQIDFWNEYLGYLKDNILDFDEKIVIYKTQNAGYHLLYKSKRVQGNLKLAVLKSHKEAVIETRGIGGYIFAYPDKKISKKGYFEIEYISDDDREILMSFSKMYNFVVEVPIEPKKDKKVYNENEITPWQDYNEKTNIFDIIQDEFTVVGNLSKKYVIKRHGATSPHSGYVFKDSGCMFLFSTGTNYPHEKLITPFLAYCYRYHNGDFSAATKDLYIQGFGARLKPKEKIKINEPKINEYNLNFDDLKFPIEIFPKPIQSYILECNSKLDSNIDYMGCSLLWLISVCIGNAINIEVKKGWNENAVVWINTVGKAGIGKTPSINNIIWPLKKLNSREIKKYFKEYEKFEFYEKLSDKDKKDYPEVNRPRKSQFIANDITLEALIDLHTENENSIGMFKDEVAGWFKDMNKYRAGSDLEFWLSCWSGESVVVNRKTSKGAFIEKPFIPVLGGIQPNILQSFYTEENKENGFIDRMLLCYPDAIVDLYNDNEIDQSILNWYSDNIECFFDIIKNHLKRDSENVIIPLTAVFSPEAKKEWVRIFNNITNFQNSDNENEYLKSMYPKQKSYIPRFCLLIHVFDEFFSTGGNALLISKESVLKAEKLSNFFIANAKKIKIDSIEQNDLKNTAGKGNSVLEKLTNIFKEDPNFNRSKTADILGVSRQYISRLLKEIEKKQV